MGNQQATPFELGWLVGAIDGEGCIGISRRNKRGKLGFTLKPHVQIANCDKTFIDRCTTILEKINVPFHVSFYAGKNRRRESWQIAIAGLKRVDKILPQIAEFLCEEKREKALLVQEYITSRLSDWHAAPFTKRQLEITELVSKLNVKGTKGPSLRDYTRSSRSSKFPYGNNTRDDIVQTTTAERQA